jgi:hypothetical protein
MVLGSTQPLTEMSTRNLPGGKKRPARRADNLAAIYEPMSKNVGASTSRNPKGLHGLYRDNFTFTTYLRLDLPSDLFPSGFPTNILYAFLYSPFVLHALPISSSLTSSF